MFEKGDMAGNDFPCEILKCISKGGMAQVFLARLRNTNHIFMIKGVEKSFRETAEYSLLNYHSEILRKEARLLEKLYHPCIPEIYEYMEASDRQYFIMSYHAGAELSQYVLKYGMLEEKEIQNLMLNMCEILAYLHGRGIIHGDIKPSNILYAEDKRITLVDFGMAKEMEKYNNILDLHIMDDQIHFQGTLGYAAPECWQSFGMQMTFATDIFALGALLFYLLEGKEPKEHYGKFTLTNKQKKNRWQPVLDWCCALNIKNRCNSIAEVYEMVKKISC